jgi:dTMP kinase
MERNQQKGIADFEGRFEEEALVFHERVREGYLRLAEEEPERFRIVDGTRSPEEAHSQILSLMAPFL